MNNLKTRADWEREFSTFTFTYLHGSEYAKKVSSVIDSIMSLQSQLETAHARIAEIAARETDYLEGPLSITDDGWRIPESDIPQEPTQ